MAAFQRAPGRPECQYGLDCYRRNAEHWQQFDHPAAHKFLAAAPQAPSAKRRGRQDDEEAAAGPKRQHVATASGSAASSSSSTATSASAPASATVITAVLVFAPGAGGSTARAMRELQETELRARGLAVARCDDEPLDTGEKRWVTSAAGHQGNLAHVVAVCRRAAQRYPDAPLVLCGASFGCRVLAETLRTAREELPAACRRDALICCGYPLHAEGKPEGADPKRAAHLLQLPESLHTLFVQGTRDTFLAGDGLACLHRTTDRMAGRVTVFAVPGGTHTVPMATGLAAHGTTKQLVASDVADAIATFVAAACEP